MPRRIEREPDGNFGLDAFLRLPESFGDLCRERIAMFCERLDQLTRDILGDFNRFSDRSTLNGQPLEIITGGQVTTFLQWLNADRQDQFIHQATPFEHHSTAHPRLWHGPN